MKKKMIISLAVCVIISATSFLFHHTQKSFLYERQGRAAFILKKHDKAEEHLLKALETTSHKKRVLLLLLENGRSYNPPIGAEKAFKLLGQKKEQNSTILTFLSDYFLEFQRFDLAEKVYQYRVTFDDSKANQINLTECLLWQKKYAQANEIIDKLQQQNPKDRQILKLWIECKALDQRYSLAIQGYENLVQLGELSGEEFLNYAEILRFDGQNEKAAEIYQKVIGQTENEK